MILCQTDFGMLRVNSILMLKRAWICRLSLDSDQKESIFQTVRIQSAVLFSIVSGSEVNLNDDTKGLKKRDWTLSFSDCSFQVQHFGRGDKIQTNLPNGVCTRQQNDYPSWNV